jgi:hypothetical protein
LLLLERRSDHPRRHDRGPSALGIVDALFPSDAVMHITEHSQPSSHGRRLEPRQIWRDHAAGEARIEGGLARGIVIYRDGQRFSLRDGELTAETTTPAFPVGELLGSLGALLYSQPQPRMKFVTVDDVEALRLRIKNQCIDSPCGDTILFVSRSSFLPIKVQHGSQQTVFEHERLARSALGSNFFSIDVLLAMARATPSPPQQWIEAGHAAYWLGPAFHDLVPDASVEDGGFSGLLLNYSAPSSMTGAGCLTITHRTDLVPPLPPPVESLRTLAVPIGEVTIYRNADQWAVWHRLTGGGTLVAATCASGGGFASLDAMTAVAQALRAYDGPSNLGDFAALSQP